MTQTNDATYDLVGVGFGPSNIALAIALEEANQQNKTINALFLDKQVKYQWHGDTITDQSGLQVSFLKDLVTQRNPQSPYTFLNYLKTHDRLIDFINLGTFCPSRLEFNDYLNWVASHFSELCSYDNNVTAIHPVYEGSNVTKLKIDTVSSNGEHHVHFARSLVFSTGGSPNIPAAFQELRDSARVFHHSHYLSKLSKLAIDKNRPLKVAVIGGGQSAAEAILDLNNRYDHGEVDLLFQSDAMRPADSSPFVNEVFNPSTTNRMFEKSHDERQRLLTAYKHTNYSAVDADMLDQVYQLFYMQKITKKQKHSYNPNSQITQAKSVNNKIELTVLNKDLGITTSKQYDLVILATGYQRPKNNPILAPLQEHLGDFTINRNYQVKTGPNFAPPIFVQGLSESTHGLSDTLLSVLAIRSQEIASALQHSLKI
ncbi:L-ornithine N(5)-monooxygenase [Pseudoalteromonas holothuriae]|uniref:L-ornithine N(5)-monooxygenase n=1 Tax=Pseudoalteromonas holothuriae TaxID=2963714 RepID=A0ABN8UNU6_9GAMM|nr:lysine N(6)-hydroxylase/L-ornithine N(5)-oxygenase family protein [Pseudoalteromonas sp. CIP111951]CAH9056679.1 L-ornithine N(5)-monooxygenase [Pseudoalteromonas sp. CIP111951]